MEDAATAEISRCQIWQWLKHSATMTDGRKVEKTIVQQTLQKQAKHYQQTLGEQAYAKRKYDLAVKLFEK